MIALERLLPYALSSVPTARNVTALSRMGPPGSAADARDSSKAAVGVSRNRASIGFSFRGIRIAPSTGS
jgi:hypothetical protein